MGRWQVVVFHLFVFAPCLESCGTSRDAKADDGVWVPPEIRPPEVWDLKGTTFTEEWDDNSDGTVDRRGVHTYDGSGRPVKTDRYVYSYYSNGKVKIVERRAFIYDTNLKEVVVPFQAGVLQRRGIDGTTYGRTEYTYDAAGNVATQEEDPAMDGTPDARIRYLYTTDSVGRHVIKEYDLHADGSINTRMETIYEWDGVHIISEHDYDANGTVDSRMRIP